MPDIFETAVFGDGVITIPIPIEEDEMPIALGETISELLLTESAANVQASNNRNRGGFDTVAVALAASVGQKFAEVDLVEGRTASGILATPIASPTKSA